MMDWVDELESGPWQQFIKNLRENGMEINYIKTLLEMSDEALAAELERAPIKRIREKLRLALMQQDRDTRQACAESVNRIGILAFDTKEEAELVHNAIMNTKNV